MKFVAVTGKVAEPALFSIWSEQLGDIPADRLNAACDCLMKTWRFPNLPLPGDVRAQLDQAEAKGFDLEAETEWQKLLAWVRENVFPDTGIRRGAPHLPPAVEHAAKAAGGFYFIERCPEDQLVWCRKTFLAAYKNVHEAGQAEYLLGAGEARRILAQLQAGPPERKQLSRATDSPGEPPSREEVRAVLLRVIEQKPTQSQEPTQDELAARWSEQKRLARQWAVEHGMESVL